MRASLPAAFLGALTIVLSASAAPLPADEALSLPLGEVELADEPREMERGLMFREDLCPRCGMLFVFPRERPATFWMKNTPVSLDMIFIDSAGEVVALHERTVPMRERPVYASPVPARYVLEVPAGFAAAHGVAVGRRIDLEELLRNTVDYRWP